MNKKTKELSLLGVISDIREKTGVGHKVMLLDLADALADKINWTGLLDRTGRKIMNGQIVHWSDGGEKLSLECRIKTRWDRIAVVEKEIGLSFRVIDSPSKSVREDGHRFHYGSFVYSDTHNHLTIVADSEEDYRRKYKNAGDCMAHVIKINKRVP